MLTSTLPFISMFAIDFVITRHHSSDVGLFPQVDLLMPPEDFSCGVAHLCGRMLTEEELAKGEPFQDEPLREVVVIRDPPTVHVYNVMEHGRRHFMELVFSTSDVATYHTQLTSTVVELEQRVCMRKRLRT